MCGNELGKEKDNIFKKIRERKRETRKRGQERRIGRDKRREF